MPEISSPPISNSSKQFDMEQDLSRRLQTAHHEEVRRMERASMAKFLGLPQGEFAKPWPGNSFTFKSAGWLPGAILGALMLLGGAGLGAYLISQLPKSSEKTTIEKVTEKAGENWDVKVDMDIVKPDRTE